jgi:hypothetical protein
LHLLKAGGAAAAGQERLRRAEDCGEEAEMLGPDVNRQPCPQQVELREALVRITVIEREKEFSENAVQLFMVALKYITHRASPQTLSSSVNCSESSDSDHRTERVGRGMTFVTAEGFTIKLVSVIRRNIVLPIALSSAFGQYFILLMI